MKIGISQDAYLKDRTSSESVRRIAKIGFDKLDFNLSDWCYKESPLASDNWKQWIEEIKRTAENNNISFSQVHAPIYNFLDKDENYEFLDLMTDRMFKICRILDIPWAVFHPRFYSNGIIDSNRTRTIESNVTWLKELSEKGMKYNTGIAIENLFNFYTKENGTINSYCKSSDEILELINKVDRNNIGVCLDTGHANISGYDPAEMVNAFGPLLKVLHINDNNSKGDQHVLPFVGNIKWEQFMKALKKNDFKNTFSFEVHNYVQRLPEELIDDGVALILKTGKYLIDNFYK